MLAKIKPTLIALKLCIERQKGFGRRTLVLKGELMQTVSCRVCQFMLRCRPWWPPSCDMPVLPGHPASKQQQMLSALHQWPGTHAPLRAHKGSTCFALSLDETSVADQSREFLFSRSTWLA